MITQVAWEVLIRWVGELYGWPVQPDWDETVEGIVWVRMRSGISRACERRRVVLVMGTVSMCMQLFAGFLEFISFVWVAGKDIVKHGNEENVLMCIGDFRFGVHERQVKGFLSQKGCEEYLRRRSVLTRSSGVCQQDIRPLIVKGPFNVSFLALMSRGLVSESLRRVVLNQLDSGFETGYEEAGLISGEISRFR